MTSIAEAKRLIEKHQRAAPVQMVPIAREFGVNVYRVSGWPDNTSGRIYRSETLGGESGFAIEVNGNHAETRRRFTIAHEIAHYILHRERIGFGDGLYDDALYRSGLSSFEERQANRFSERLLMPDHLVREALQTYGSDVETLASVFNVSEQAMAIRLGVPN